jgi:DNA-binding transcriptional ArsR family regulator
MVSSLEEQQVATDEELDAVFHALSDRTRRALISRLSHGPAIITELAEPFQMTLAAVSKHLRVLENAKLIRREVDGRFHRCSFNPKPLSGADRWLHDYRTFWEETLDGLVEYVKTLETETKP